MREGTGDGTWILMIFMHAWCNTRKGSSFGITTLSLHERYVSHKDFLQSWDL
jgi:hypothetical protein